LRHRHGFGHGFPLIRSLRASAQPSTSVLFSFVLSLIVAASFTIRQSKTILGHSCGVKNVRLRGKRERWVSALDREERTMWVVDAHGYEKRFIVHAATPA